MEIESLANILRIFGGGSHHNTGVVLTMGIESLASIWTKAMQTERFGLQTVFHPLIVIVIGIFSTSKPKEKLSFSTMTITIQ